MRPVVAARWPQLPCAAARLGSGSDVLSLVDATSTDQDWGLRLNLLVPNGLDSAAGVARVARVAGAVSLTAEVDGHLTRFATTWDPQVRHRVRVETGPCPRRLTARRCPTHDLTVNNWLSVAGQSVLEVRDAAVTVLTDDIGDAAVRVLPRDVGSVEQWSDNVDGLTDVGRARRRTV